MMISWGKPKKVGHKTALMPLGPHRISFTVTMLNPRLHGGKPAPSRISRAMCLFIINPSHIYIVTRRSRDIPLLLVRVTSSRHVA
jgi:hypothetical protein